MSKFISEGMPTACIAINKCRAKVYGKNSELPTYYLQKGLLKLISFRVE